MRFRLMRQQERDDNGASNSAGMWKPCGGIQIADTPDEALSEFGPVAGTWMVLCEETHTWRVYEVTKRTETDIKLADEDAPAISGVFRR